MTTNVVISCVAGYIDNTYCQIGGGNMQGLMLNHGEDLQVVLFFGFLMLFLLIERLSPARIVRRKQGQRWLTNAGLSLLAIMVLPVLPVTLITAGFWAEQNGVGLLNMPGDWLPVWLVAVLTLLLRGFISFFTHFLNHRLPWLWRLHRVHHMDTELDVSSTVRFHPLEMPVSMLVGLPLILVFGLSPWALLLYELLDATVVVFSHSNTRIPAKLDRYLRYFIVTPDLHKVHHSAYQPETDSNYSAVFPIWDILFGTFRTQTREPLSVMKLGLSEVEPARADNFFWLLGSPFLNLGPGLPSMQQTPRAGKSSGELQ